MAGAFDTFVDTPFQIKTEGETISVKFLPGVPNTGQGTVRWTLPIPAQGCATEDGLGVYCGILVALSTRAHTLADAPRDGVLYEGDNTASSNLHAGDRLGKDSDVLVVGAFYEGEKRSRIAEQIRNDQEVTESLTTELVISDLTPGQAYYVIVYAVDCQLRYHTEGMRAYSANFGNQDGSDTSPYQNISLNDQTIYPTDGTGLIPGRTYEFDLLVSEEFNPRTPFESPSQIVRFSADGADIGTYANLITEVNKAIALVDNPDQSPTPPNQGRYYWDGTSVYQWNGYQNVLVDGILYETSDPSIVPIGQYWYNTSTSVLSQLTSSSPIIWTVQDVITYHEDPTAIFGGDDYWYNTGNQTGYLWCTNTWCEQTTIVAADDPSCAPTPTCASFWYDETNELLFNWNVETNVWDQAYAIMWDVAPNALVSGTYWYNTTDSSLQLWTGSPSSFQTITDFVDSNEEPDTLLLPNGTLWYNNDTEELFEWVIAGTSSWVVRPVVVWPMDPTDTDSCDLWWNTDTDVLYKWDIVNSQWNAQDDFTISTINPYSTPTLTAGTLWYDTTTDLLKKWNGAVWVDTTFISQATDPTVPPAGQVWYNSSTEIWSVWNASPAEWQAFDPIDSAFDPTVVPQGTKWFNTSTNTLYERIGSSWVSIPYSTSSLSPSRNALWYDTTNDILMQWTGIPTQNQDGTITKQYTWTQVDPIATFDLVSADPNNRRRDGAVPSYLQFVALYTGSGAFISVLVPRNTPQGEYTGLVATGTAGSDTFCCMQPSDGYVSDLSTPITPTTFLFSHLQPQAVVLQPKRGLDGLSGQPTYAQVGIGDDGTPDERRALATSIREQLGYPVVEVELTTNQIDTAIDLALASLRKRSGSAYRRGFMMLDVQAGQQHYCLSSEMAQEQCSQPVKFNEIVTVMSAYRFTSAFLSSAHGAGVYGQIVLQHLYNMGTFDLVSYHLVAQYVEQMEHLFATRLTYHWHEQSRTLSFHHVFAAPERVALDVTAELSEQELMKDRWTRTWISRYALAESMRMLARIRGKYASLPGAGGGITLNAAELMAEHDAIKEELYSQIDDFIVNDAEEVGMESTFIIG